jgi:uncharacterized protein YecE (DUF72 family)
MAHIYAGTSGFAYTTWKPTFYPADVPSSRFLDHYATRLNCVEVNYTFRRVASAKTLDTWIAKTPPHFLFCPKAHMRITHILQLKEAEEFTSTFLRSLEPLANAKRLGPILFQLPPHLKCQLEDLSAFLEMIPKSCLCAFEFRNPTWFNDDVYQTLRKYSAALCLAESEKLESPDVITGDFAYFRFRKPDYSTEDRRAIAAKVQGLLAQNKDVYVFFKHEDTPDGALNAEKLLKDLT